MQPNEAEIFEIVRALSKQVNMEKTMEVSVAIIKILSTNKMSIFERQMALLIVHNYLDTLLSSKND